MHSSERVLLIIWCVVGIVLAILLLAYAMNLLPACSTAPSTPQASQRSSSPSGSPSTFWQCTFSDNSFACELLEVQSQDI